MGGEAKKVVVLPSEAQEASRGQSVHVPMPHTGAPSAPAALIQFSLHAVIQSCPWLRFQVQRSICTQVLAATGLFDLWPEHKASPPLSDGPLQPPTTSLTHWKMKTEKINPLPAFLVMPLEMFNDVISAVLQPVWTVWCVRQSQGKWWTETQDVSAVLRIRAVAFTQERPHTPVLMPVDGYIYRTHHSIPLVTHTVCSSYQPFQNTGDERNKTKTYL